MRELGGDYNAAAVSRSNPFAITEPGKESKQLPVRTDPQTPVRKSSPLPFSLFTFPFIYHSAQFHGVGET